MFQSVSDHYIQLHGKVIIPPSDSGAHPRVLHDHTHPEPFVPHQLLAKQTTPLTADI